MAPVLARRRGWWSLYSWGGTCPISILPFSVNNSPRPWLLFIYGRRAGTQFTSKIWTIFDPSGRFTQIWAIAIIMRQANSFYWVLDSVLVEPGVDVIVCPPSQWYQGRGILEIVTLSYSRQCSLLKSSSSMTWILRTQMINWSLGKGNAPHISWWCFSIGRVSKCVVVVSSSGSVSEHFLIVDSLLNQASMHLLVVGEYACLWRSLDPACHVHELGSLNNPNFYNTVQTGERH